MPGMCRKYCTVAIVAIVMASSGSVFAQQYQSGKPYQRGNVYRVPVTYQESSTRITLEELPQQEQQQLPIGKPPTLPFAPKSAKDVPKKAETKKPALKKAEPKKAKKPEDKAAKASDVSKLEKKIEKLQKELDSLKKLSLIHI